MERKEKERYILKCQSKYISAMKMREREEIEIRYKIMCENASVYACC